MSNNYFAFKQFTIYHDQCAMKVGTDGVLLGSWTALENTSKILDVGTGSGLIAVMLAQRSTAVIDGVEIDKDAFVQARENVAGCPWPQRINLFHDSFRHFSDVIPSRYNLIVSNPPFFQNSLKPQVKSKAMAKHDTGLNYMVLISGSSRLLTPGGRLSVIIPAADYTQFTGIADFYRLCPSRLTWIRPSPEKEYNRCLIELTETKGIACDVTELTIRGSDLTTYTTEYTELTRDYYLAF